MEQLDQIVDQIYETFSIYQPSTLAEYSPAIIIREEIINELRSTPLHELSAEQLDTFMGRTMTSWGNVGDFKYFLPRLLELFSQFNCPYDEFILLAKLEYANWKEWPEKETTIVEHFLKAFLEHLISGQCKGQVGEQTELVLLLSPHCGSLATVLNQWNPWNSTSSLKFLSHFIMMEGYLIFKRDRLGNFANIQPSFKILREYLLSDILMTELENAYFQNQENDDLANLISDAEVFLSAERTMPPENPQP